jgi:thioredoxin:protein disulfide reductase
MRRLFLLAFAILVTSVAAHAGGGSLLKPKDEPQFLPVDQAFEIQPLEIRDGKLSVGWRIAKGYYLYRQRMSVDVLSPKGDQVGAAQLPKGEKHNDEYFGEVEIYHEPLLAVQLPLKGPPPKLIKVKVSYQGCAEAGLCYPPQERLLELTP